MPGQPRHRIGGQRIGHRVFAGRHVEHRQVDPFGAPQQRQRQLHGARRFAAAIPGHQRPPSGADHAGLHRHQQHRAPGMGDHVRRQLGLEPARIRIGLADDEQVRRARMQAEAGAGFIVEHLRGAGRQSGGVALGTEGGQRAARLGAQHLEVQGQGGIAAFRGHAVVQKARNAGGGGADQVGAHVAGQCGGKRHACGGVLAVVDMHKDGLVGHAAPLPVCYRSSSASCWKL